MKVFAISDLHLSINNPKPMDVFGEVWNNYIDEITAFWEKNISDDDVVLIAGDISWAMNLEGVKPDLDYIGSGEGAQVHGYGTYVAESKHIADERYRKRLVSTEETILYNGESPKYIEFKNYEKFSK